MTRVGSPPHFENGVPCWESGRGDWRLRFYGRGAAPRAEGLTPRRPRAWLKQVHGAEVVAARAGECGTGDALLLGDAAVAATVATADCLPVALLGGRGAALVHAGWRGLVAGVLDCALERLGDPATEVAARIGPAIGPRCYEVGEAVAGAIQDSCGGSAIAVVHRLEDVLHVDLIGAARAQLAAAGVADVAVVDRCTRCNPQWLWSHRADGAGAGRNWTVLWRD
jgi:hypothetical protein